MAIQALSRTELLALLRVARAHSEMHFLMILVAFSHGLRASEVCNLLVGDLRGGFLTVQRLKGSNRTTQPLVQHPDPLLNEKAALLKYTSNQSADQRVFDRSRYTFWRIMQRHGRTAGLPAHKLHPHALKHSIAMQIISTAGIENTRQYLGHKSLSSTGFYLMKTDEEASVAVGRALRSRSRA